MLLKKFIKSTLLLMSFLFFFTSMSFAQKAISYLKNLAFINEKNNYVSIPFELTNNLIVIPVTINNSDTLKFILDSGVSHILMTSATKAEKVDVVNDYIREITIQGLGIEGEIKAFQTWGNKLILPGVIGLNQDIIFPEEDIYHLSESMGVEIDGLIGYSVFKYFVVEIDYSREVLKLYKPSYFYEKKRSRRLKKGERLPIAINKMRSYVQVYVEDHLGNATKVNLMLDTGASHALTLFENTVQGIYSPHYAIRDYLGKGLSGDMYGMVAKTGGLELGDYFLEEPIVKYPDMYNLLLNDDDSSRNGSIGAEIFRRFNVIIDYNKEEIILRKNGDFKDDFDYNLSGIDISKPYAELPYYIVDKVREKSPAYKAGIRKGDQIQRINGKSIIDMNYEQIVHLIHGRDKSKLTITVLTKYGQMKNCKMILVDPFKDLHEKVDFQLKNELVKKDMLKE